MFRKVIPLFILATLVLVACAQPTPTAAPTSLPTEAPLPTAVPATAAPAPTLAPTATTAPTSAPTATATQATTTTVARPSNPGGPGKAIDLTGDAKAGATIYAADCKLCHGDQGAGGVKNAGSDDGTVPPLNPIDDTLKDPDPKVYATNIDLFVEHGSTPSGTKPQLVMPALGDTKKLTPQQIADVVAYVMSLNPLPARPSNAGGPGPAVNLTGNASAGQQIFVANCQACHGAKGIGGVKNAGSDDGTVPPLNPIDDTLKDPDPKVYATNIDLFIEHGSTPSGTKPQLVMTALGDTNKLTPQQIADVIAYIISLNTK